MKDEKDDVVINASPELARFDWVKDFVFSEMLEKYVALAGVRMGEDEELFLIDTDGKIIEYLENE